VKMNIEFRVGMRVRCNENFLSIDLRRGDSGNIVAMENQQHVTVVMTTGKSVGQRIPFWTGYLELDDSIRCKHKCKSCKAKCDFWESV
jgi:hypothetical protein